MNSTKGNCGAVLGGGGGGHQNLALSTELMK